MLRHLLRPTSHEEIAMNDVNPVVEVLLRMFVFVMPVIGVLLLLATAHILGGAIKHTDNPGQQRNPAGTPRNTPARDTQGRIQRGRRDSKKINAA